MTKEFREKNELSTIEKILVFLQREDVGYCVQSDSQPPAIPFDLKPTDFMEFAKRDFNENTEKSLVNALSNVKRAIDCRISSLLWLFGYYETSKDKHWSFPQSADFLLRIGIIAPNILKKINRKRNELEHEFKKPTREDVVDFLDVAELFLGFTDQFLNKKYDEFDIVAAEEDYPLLFSNLISEKGLIEMSFEENKQTREEASVSTNDEENYMTILRHLVKCIMQR